MKQNTQATKLDAMLDELRTVCANQDEMACEAIWMRMIPLDRFNKNWLFERYCQVRTDAGFPYLTESSVEKRRRLKMDAADAELFR